MPPICTHKTISPCLNVFTYKVPLVFNGHCTNHYRRETHIESKARTQEIIKQAYNKVISN